MFPLLKALCIPILYILKCCNNQNLKKELQFANQIGVQYFLILNLKHEFFARNSKLHFVLS